MGNDWQSNYNQIQQQQHNYRVESQLNQIQTQLAIKNSGQIPTAGSSSLSANAYWLAFGVPLVILFFIDILTSGSRRDEDMVSAFRVIYLSYFTLWGFSRYIRPHIMQLVSDDIKNAKLHVSFLIPLIAIGFITQSFYITPIIATISFFLNRSFLAKHETAQLLAGSARALKKWFSSGKTLDDKINRNPIRIYVFEMPLLNAEGAQILKKNGFDFSSLSLFNFQQHILSGYLNGSPNYSLGAIKTLLNEVVDPRAFSVSSSDKKIDADSISYVRFFKKPDGVDAKSFESRKSNLLVIFDEYVKKNESMLFKIESGKQWVSQDSVDLSEYNVFDYDAKQWKPFKAPIDKKGGLSWRNRGAS